MQPTYLKCIREDGFNGNAIEIGQNSEPPLRLLASLLRSNCPCAKCIEDRMKQQKQTKLNRLRVIKASFEESYSIKEIRAVGNYAINIVWNDGHDTGIYTFKFLEELNNNKMTS